MFDHAKAIYLYQHRQMAMTVKD